MKYLEKTNVKIFVIIDNEGNAKKYKDDLVRRGLIYERNIHIWSKGVFTDSFSSEHIISAMKGIYGEKFTMTPENLKTERNGKKKNTEKIVNDFLHEKNLGVLNKPLLGEKLGIIIKKYIETKKTIEETEIKEVIENILKIE